MPWETQRQLKVDCMTKATLAPNVAALVSTFPAPPLRVPPSEKSLDSVCRFRLRAGSTFYPEAASQHATVRVALRVVLSLRSEHLSLQPSSPRILQRCRLLPKAAADESVAVSG